MTDFADLLTYGSDAGANTIFDFGFGNTLTIVGHNLADLDASNFDFSGSPATISLPSDASLAAEDVFAEAEMADVFDMDALI